MEGILVSVWLSPPLPPQVLRPITHLPLPVCSALVLPLCVQYVQLSLANVASCFGHLFRLLSCCCLPPSDFSLWKWSYSDISHLFTSYSLSDSVWAILCTCHSGKTTLRQTPQSVLVLMSVVVIVVDHCFSLKLSPSWMLHEWISTELYPSPRLLFWLQAPLPNTNSTGGHTDLDLTLPLLSLSSSSPLLSSLPLRFPSLPVSVSLCLCFSLSLSVSLSPF